MKLILLLAGFALLFQIMGCTTREFPDTTSGSGLGSASGSGSGSGTGSSSGSGSGSGSRLDGRLGKSVLDYGAKGDGVTDDTLAIQTALDLNQVVYFPPPRANYLVSTLTLNNDGMTLTGPGKNVPCLVGMGTGPVLVAGSPADSTLHARDLSLRSLDIANVNFSAVQIYNSPNFTIDNSVMATTNHTSPTNTIEARGSYRGTITHSNITQSGAGWAISALNNCNALTIFDNIVSGGSGGNAIDVGQSEGVWIKNNTLEIGFGYGVRISGLDPSGQNGISSGVNVSDNYFEQIQKPISIGEGYEVHGVVVSGNYVANNDAPSAGVNSRFYFLLLGRVTGAQVYSNSYTGSQNEPFLFLTYTAGVSLGFLMNSEIQHNTLIGASPIALSGFPPANPSPMATLFGSNLIAIEPNRTTGIERVFFSPVLKANQAFGNDTYALATPTGGLLTRVDVVDVTGNVSCTVDIGSLVSIYESASFNPSMIVASGQTTGSVALAAGPILRPGLDGLYRVQGGGTGTGTFRLRFTFRN